MTASDITVYGFGPSSGLPDASPFVMKAQTLLKMANLPFRVGVSSPLKAPKGKLPFIDDGGRIVADTAFIRAHIEAHYRVDFDAGLSDRQKAIAWAFERMAEDNLYWALLDARWTADSDFDNGPRRFFDAVPFVMRPIVIAMVRRKVRQALHAQGLGRHSQQEIAAIGTRSIDAIAIHLDREPYFMGADPKGVDATIFAMIANILCPAFDSPLRTAAERHGNLRDYVTRMGARYFPEFTGATERPA